MNERPPAVHWEPVLAGLLAALTVTLLLATLGGALGLTDGTPAGARMARVWAVLGTLIAFFLGGFTAGRLAHLGERSSVLHGLLVFMLAVPVIAWLQGHAVAAGWLPAALGAGRATAWTTFVSAVVGLIASGSGGWLASHPRFHSWRVIRA